MTFSAPVAEQNFVLKHIVGIDALAQHARFADATPDMVQAIVEGIGAFAEGEFAPLNRIGDTVGARLVNGKVVMPEGFVAAYKSYVANGWGSINAPAEFGGQGLPFSLATVALDSLGGANMAFALCPILSVGAIEAINHHGTDRQKELFLPKLSTGAYSGTMNLTEPQAVSDVGALKSTATPRGDGTYQIKGTKIYISFGDHDMAENIVHLVLARTPDGPAGTKGISLFVVPKFVPDAQGQPGVRNTITCGAIEHKMGIHGNATCQINLDGATGWLIGEPHRGLNAMFVMMNAARLGVGMQSLGLTEVAYQNARAYALERTQGRSLTGPKHESQPADTIIVHPDVRRMLLTARAFAEGGRAFTSYVALMIDRELNHPDEDERKQAADEVALLTPIIKAFLTDNAWIATSEALQVFGGHGYIAEWGMEQYVRDARINMIYEGTNTIQSLDLLGRKVLMDNGEKLRAFGDKIKSFIEENGTDEAMSEFITPLADIGDKVTKLTMEIGMKAFQNRDEVGAAAVPYLRVLGHLVFAYFFARMAKIALEKSSSGDGFYQAKLGVARFYFARLLPETAMLIRQARSGAGTLMAMDAELF